MNERRSREEGIVVLLSLFYAILVVGLMLSGGMGYESGGRGEDRAVQERRRDAGEQCRVLAQAAAEGALLRLREGHDAAFGLETPVGNGRSSRVRVEQPGPGVLDIRVHLLHPVGNGQATGQSIASVRYQAGVAALWFRPPAATVLCLARADALDGDQLPSGLDPRDVAAGGDAAARGFLAVGDERFALDRMLGVAPAELARMADLAPDPLEGVERYEGLCVLRGARQFDTRRPLVAEGLVFADGDLELVGSGHDVEGVLIVTGDLVVSGRLGLRGMLVVCGRATFGPAVHLRWDEEAIDRVRRWVCGPRLVGPPTRVSQTDREGR